MSAAKDAKKKRKKLASALIECGIPEGSADGFASRLNVALNSRHLCVRRIPEPSARSPRGRSMPRSWM